MSTGALQATLPLYQEACKFWDDLTSNCHEQLDAINNLVAQQSARSKGIQFRASELKLELLRPSFPSTEITVDLAFEHWGPAIQLSVKGEEADQLYFYPEEFDFRIGLDSDQSVVAISSEGKSLDAHQFTKYILQHFRRSYPGISLPCPECMLS